MGILDSVKDYFVISPKGDQPAAPRSAAKPKPPVTQLRSARNSYSDISEIVTLDPTSFADVRTIAEHFCNDIPLIINMASLSEKDSLRTLDFLLGLKEGRHGQLKRVTPKVFLLTPQNVAVNQGEEEESDEEFIGQ